MVKNNLSEIFTDLNSESSVILPKSIKKSLPIYHVLFLVFYSRVSEIKKSRKVRQNIT